MNFKRYQRQSPRIYILSFVFLFLFQSLVLPQTGKDVTGKNGMAATAHPLATQAAMDILAKGGNAVDAAVAAAFTIGVVEPDGSGLGGGGGMLIRLAKDEKSVFINYYQRTSGQIASMSYDFEKDKRTAKSILVPGTVAGLLTALSSFGTMTPAEVVAPALKYAREGFVIDETLGKIILDNIQVLQTYSETANTFLPGGFPLSQGDTLKQLKLAGVLEQIALQGRKGFYEGETAKAISAEIMANGGMVTEDDLRRYEPVVSEPLKGRYRGFEILTSPPPQSGATVLEALNIIENTDIASGGHFSANDKSLHFLSETFKRTSADRSAYLGDPKFGSIPVNGIISKKYANERYGSIDMSRVNPPENKLVKSANPSKYDVPYEAIAPAANQDDTIIESDQQDDEVMPPSKTWKNDKFDSWGKKKSLMRKKQPSKIQLKDTTDTIKDNDQYDAWDMNSVPVLAEADGEGGHTTHLSVADKDGNLVSLTQTLGNFFGSGLSADGILMNNGLVNFSAVSEKNRIEPDKQPRSSISPTILIDRKHNRFTALGSPGAGRIIPTVVQLIVNLVDFNMSLAEANDAPRMYSQKFDEKTYVEGRVPKEVVDNLIKRGHRIQVYDDFDLFFGGAQLVMYDLNTGLFYGSADKRRGGSAGGRLSEE